MTLSHLNTRVLVDGKPIKQYSDNQGRKWIEARDGSIYEIEVKNNSSDRVLAVFSVDGLNVISGEPAAADPEDGYVIEAYSSLKIKGWRTSDEEVKEFIFNFNKKDSYSVKIGAGDSNLGVIGIAFFDEKKTLNINWPPKYIEYHHHYYPQYPVYPVYPQYPTYPTYPVYPYYTYTDSVTTSGGEWTATCAAVTCCSDGVTTSNNNVVVSMSNNSSDESVHIYNTTDAGEFSPAIDFLAGTSKGDAVESKVDNVDFESDKLIGTQEIYYDSFDNLKKRGIIDFKKKEMPKPFKQSKYCPDI